MLLGSRGCQGRKTRSPPHILKWASPKNIFDQLSHQHVKFNLLEEAQVLFDKMSERNVVSWTTLISAYSNAKLNDRAMSFLVFIFRVGVVPNMFTFSSVLRACERLYDLKQLHSWIMKVGLESDVFVRSALIDVY